MWTVVGRRRESVESIVFLGGGGSAPWVSFEVCRLVSRGCTWKRGSRKVLPVVAQPDRCQSKILGSISRPKIKDIRDIRGKQKRRRQPLRLTSARRAPGGVDVCPPLPWRETHGEKPLASRVHPGPPTMSKAGLFIRSYKCVVSHVQLHMRDGVLSAAAMAQFPSF